MKIENCSIEDIEEIFRLYRIATAFQKTKFIVHWPDFERSLVETEIMENRQWKIVIDEQVACVWATTYSDPLIWEEKNSDPSVYIHRIATNPDYRGNHLVTHMVAWAREHAMANNKKYVRLDTVGENEKLIDYYTKCGFRFLGLSKLKNTNGLPAHYDNASVSLFELTVTPS